MKHGSSSVAFGACVPRYLARAPPGVVRFLLLPEKEVYTRRWQNRNPSDTQSHDKLLEEAVNVSKAPTIRVISQPVDECVDQTVWRMCNELKNSPETLSVGAERRPHARAPRLRKIRRDRPRQAAQGDDAAHRQRRLAEDGGAECLS